MSYPDSFSLLITGGGSGIGAGAARYFCEQGAKVTICGRRSHKIQEVVESAGPLCHGVVADITLAEDRRRLVKEAAEFGGGLSGLINNAGNMYRSPLEGVAEDQLLQLFHTNVVAGMMLTQSALPYLKESRGSILFLGSVHNKRAFPGASPYAATKGALDALTKSLAAELGGHGVRVNCLVPGAVASEINQRAGLFTEEEAQERFRSLGSLHALGRIGTVEEVAQAMESLLLGQWTTGASMTVDGGLSLGLTNH